MNILLILLLFIIQILVFFSCGLVTTALLKMRIRSVSLTLVTGFITFFAAFEFIVLPATLMQMPLHTVALIIASLALLLVVLALVLLIRHRFDIFKELPGSVKYHGPYIILFVLSFLLLMYLAFTQVEAGADAAYYLGQVSTDVYTDSLNMFSPYTGVKENTFYVRYLFSVFPDYNAVIARLSGIHPLKQAKLIMPEIIMMMSFLVYYQIGKAIFKGDRKQTDIFLVFISLFNLAMNTSYTAQTFIMTRTYEGKAILASLIIPMMVYCFVRLYQNKSDKTILPLVLLTSLAAETFTTSAMMVVPVGLTAGLLPLIFARKNGKMLLYYLVALLPHLIVLACYVLVEKGVFAFYIH